MSEKKLNSKSLKNILRGGGIWLLSLLLFSVLASIIAMKTEISEKMLVYASSVLTFVSSAAAGNTLNRKKEKILCCLLLGLFLMIAALSFGFFLDSSRFDTGGILSVVSFTLCGVMTGYILELPGKKRSKIKLSS